MSEQKHTPGPWVPWEDDDGMWGVLKDNAFLTTAFPPDIGGVDGASEANARLIAAAPDMLEALKPFAKIIDSLGPDEGGSTAVWVSYDYLVAARKAISKAQGS